MAKADISLPNVPLHPGGVNDGQPVAEASLAFFRARGFAIQFGEATRMNGKKLIEVLEAPIIGIHCDSRNAVWVQTSEQLILYTDFFHAFL